MGFYFHRIPAIIQKSLANHTWSIPNIEKKIFLTFDDGPTSEVTDFVLDTLEKYNAKATFFMLGNCLNANRKILSRVQRLKHQIANHGYQHLDGWRTSYLEYKENQMKGGEALRQITGRNSFLFRPPYGHFRGNEGVVLWSLMSGDFDSSLSKEVCLRRLVKRTRPGDVILFHDNLKSFELLKWVLPRYLKFCQERGYKFELVPDTK